MSLDDNNITLETIEENIIIECPDEDMVVEIKDCITFWASILGQPSDNQQLVNYINGLLATKQDLVYFVVATEASKDSIPNKKTGTVAFVKATKNLYIYFAEEGSTAEWILITKDLSVYYTKTETDALLALKANISDVYSKIEADSRFASLVNFNAHLNNHNNPHQVTKAQVGLGNVDNTSDLNKPISTAIQNALNNKQDTLVSGTNIKTINNNSVLGSGNLVIDTASATWGNITGTLSNQEDLQRALNAKADQTALTYEATARRQADANLQEQINNKQPNLTSANAGEGISITGVGAGVKINNTRTSAEWGNITGTLSDQIDLQNALNTKVTANNPTTAGTKCKITYDSKGLVTSGADLIVNDIPNLPLSKISAITVTADKINLLEGATSNIQDQLDNKVVKNNAITGATKTKITYDSKGLITAGADLIESDIPNLHLAKITDVTSTAAEVNYLSGATSNIQEQINLKLNISDVINNITTTTANQALSANMGKELQDQINNLKQRGRYLSVWDCTLGKAQTTPTVNPYVYKAGDYFLVGVVASQGGTNYRPNGSTYDKDVPSTTVETGSVVVNDAYYYDGTSWTLLHTEQPTIAFSTLAGSPYDNANLTSALNAKVTGNNVIAGATKTKITYDSKGLVTSGTDLSASDIPNLTLNKITDVTASAGELNILDGATLTTIELNYVDGVTSNIQTQLNSKAVPSDIKNGVLTIQKNGTNVATFSANQSTAQTANIIVPTKISDLTDDTSTNPIDKADTLTGLTATVTELNYTDGITSNIQTQLNGKQPAGNYVSYTNSTATVAGTSKTVSKTSPECLFINNGLIMGGTAASAGLVTRGICGVGTPDSTTGACTKDNLYLNYDGNDTNNPNGRGIVINAGSVGTDLGSGMYSYCATRGDVVKTWVEAKGYTSNIGTITGITMNGSSKGTSGVVDLGTVITDVSGKENTSNKVTSISSSSTNTQYPSAKCVYDAINNIPIITNAEIDIIWEAS